jgi:hypothetical protein
MPGYRQWVNGVVRRAAVRWRWRELEHALASSRAKRLARILAALATATAIVTTIGVAAKLGEARAGAERAPRMSGSPMSPSTPLQTVESPEH